MENMYNECDTKYCFIMNEYIIRHVACDDDMKYVMSTSILLFTALHVSVVIFIWCVKI